MVRASSAFAVTVGLAVLAGWVFDVPVLKTVLPGYVTMKANTALAFVLAGAALALLAPSEASAGRVRSGRVLAALVVLIGALTLSQELAGWNLGIDELLVSDNDTARVFTSAPGRMAVATAIAFSLLGLALLALEWNPPRGPAPSELLAAAVFLLSSVAAVAYLYSQSTVVFPRTRMALHTFITFYLLCAGVLAARPQRGVVGAVRARMATPLERRVYGALALSVLTLFVSGAAAFFGAAEATERSRWVDHTHEVRLTLARLLSAHQDLETGERGYVITGKPEFLEPYETGRWVTSRIHGDLARLVSDNPAQIERLARLDVLRNEHEGWTALVVETRRTLGREAAESLVVGSDGKRLMDALRNATARMDAEEARLLEARAEEGRAAVGRLNATLAASTLLAFFVVLFAAIVIHRDFARRQRAEAALRESEESLSTTLSSIGDAVLATDTQGCVTRMNTVAERLTGWPFAEARGRPVGEVFRIVNEHTRAPAEMPVARVLATGTVQGLANHTLLLARNGAEHPIADSASPLRDATGLVTGVVLVFRDATSERTAERLQREHNDRLEVRVRERTAQLEESEARLKTTVDHLSEGVVVASIDGRLLELNHAAVEMHGFVRREEYLHHATEFQDVFELVNLTGQVLPFEEWPLPRVLRGATLREFDIVLRRRDGAAERIISYGGALVPGPDGKPVLAVLTCRDITARHRADEEIRALNASLEQRVAERTAEVEQVRRELQDLYDAAPCGYHSVDEDGLIVRMNDTWLAWLGYAREEVVGCMHHPDIMTPESAAAFRERWFPLFKRQGWLADAEFEYVRKDGSTLVGSLQASLIRDAQGRFVASRSVVADITEQRHAAEQVRALNADLEERTRQLENASRAKSDFLATMSHELRTPLNSIIGFSEMLKDGVLGPLEDRQRGFIGDIYAAGAHLLSLINDILDLSKVEAGMMQLEAAPVDLAELLRASPLVVREKAHAHRLQLGVRLAADLGPMLADDRKVKQIVYNLLSNAVKFTPDGGSVTLAARRCVRADVLLERDRPGRLFPLPPGDASEFVEISVEDTGVGIPEESLSTLFEPFSQVDASVSRRYGGTGLGLSLVRRLAELHGGTVGVASRAGAGSRFVVWLPFRAAEPARPRDVAEGTVLPVGVSAIPLALVVEDDDRMAVMIEEELRRDGFEVMRAATGEEGLVRAHKRKPDLITLDIFLPSMDGWEFLRRLRADAHLAETPVVIVTVSKDHDRGLALGARRVLQKPFERDELIAALSGLLPRRPGSTAARVLVVDDNRTAVDLLAAVLEPEGYLVLRAYGGAEAIDVARHERPDLVVLDLMMPEVSGFEVAQALRQSEDTVSIPILVLTAKDLTAQDRVRLKGSVSGVLEKSRFSGAELLAELHRALARRPEAEGLA